LHSGNRRGSRKKGGKEGRKKTKEDRSLLPYEGFAGQIVSVRVEKGVRGGKEKRKKKKWETPVKRVALFLVRWSFPEKKGNGREGKKKKKRGGGERRGCTTGWAKKVWNPDQLTR